MEDTADVYLQFVLGIVESDMDVKRSNDVTFEMICFPANSAYKFFTT